MVIRLVQYSKRKGRILPCRGRRERTGHEGDDDSRDPRSVGT